MHSFDMGVRVQKAINFSVVDHCWAIVQDNSRVEPGVGLDQDMFTLELQRSIPIHTVGRDHVGSRNDIRGEP